MMERQILLAGLQNEVFVHNCDVSSSVKSFSIPT